MFRLMFIFFKHIIIQSNPITILFTKKLLYLIYITTLTRHTTSHYLFFYQFIYLFLIIYLLFVPNNQVKVRSSNNYPDRPINET